MTTVDGHPLRSVRLWVAVTVGVAVLLAAAGTVAVQRGLTDRRAGGPVRGVASGALPPSLPGRVSPAILSAVATSEAITAGQARERLARQADLARLAEAVAPSLDRARTAGLYLDQAAGVLVVTVTTPGASGPTRDNVREVPVRYSSNDLDRAASAVAVAVAATGAEGLTWAIDVRVNAVVVAVLAPHAGLPSTRALLAQATALGPVVRTKVVKEVETTAEGTGLSVATGGEVAAGDWGGVCSVAWPVRDQTGNDGILTAGHCVTNRTTVWTRAERVLGRAVVHGHGPRDFGVIRAEPGGARLGTKVNLYDGSYAILTGQSSAPVGSVICKSGAASRLTCGTITAARISSAEDGRIFDDLVGMRMCADNGDSGGAVFVPHIDGTVWAQGIISRGIEACHPAAGRGDREIIDNGMLHQPISIVLSEQRLTLRVG